MNGWVKTAIAVGSAALISWGAWNTLATTGATPRDVHDAHCLDNKRDFQRIDDKFYDMQQRIEDKLDKIQTKLGE